MRIFLMLLTDYAVEVIDLFGGKGGWDGEPVDGKGGWDRSDGKAGW